ncbi:MAG: tetraacyldisaccharide 4'-kinase [Leptospiraceae bacterium]|nr:tetraacyldisaccharide 4'-kinase [Leptospiraceae bacterium]
MNSNLKKIFSILLFPFTYLYQFMFFLDQKFTKKKKIDNSLVLSIGNLTLGGSGKTPFTMYMVKLLNRLGKKNITVLSRGYGGTKSNEGMKVELESSPLECGDEPLLLKKNYPEIEVIIGKNRFQSFQKFSSRKDLKESIILLDDGFQHHALDRDYDFVLVDSLKGLGNGRTIPAGFLREKKSALSRADFLIFTKVNSDTLNNVNRMKEEWMLEFPNLKFFEFSFIPIRLVNLEGESFNPEFLFNKKVLAFCGIAKPESFFSIVKTLKPKTLETRIFSDHANYSLNQIFGIMEEASSFDLVLCTEKDIVKVSRMNLFTESKSKIYSLHNEVRMKNEEDFESLMSEIIQKKFNY